MNSKYSLAGIFLIRYIWFIGQEDDLNTARDMKTLSTLGEPNRMAIVELLRDGALTVGEIADQLKLRQPQASKHLKILAENDILEVKAEANRRIYKLRPEPFQSLDSWVKSFTKIMEERYDKLDDYLEKLKKEEKEKNKKK